MGGARRRSFRRENVSEESQTKLQSKIAGGERESASDLRYGREEPRYGRALPVGVVPSGVQHSHLEGVLRFSRTTALERASALSSTSYVHSSFKLERTVFRSNF